MKKKPTRRLTAKEVIAIRDAPGSLRDIAFQYAISHTLVRNIKNGSRKPFRSSESEATQKWPLHTSAVGTITNARLLRPSSEGRYWLKLLLAGQDAVEIQQLVDAVIRSKVAEIATDSDVDALDAGDSGARPYKKATDGSYVFSFRAFAAPDLVTSRGGVLRKPDRVVAGTRVSVVYSVVPWHRRASERDPLDIGPDSTGVGAVLTLRTVVLAPKN